MKTFTETVKYEVRTSGYKDYVDFSLGDMEIVQIKTTPKTCGWISQELNVVVNCANAYMEMLPNLRKLRGMEAWIGDRQMKELFQKILYPILDAYEEQRPYNFQKP